MLPRPIPLLNEKQWHQLEKRVREGPTKLQKQMMKEALERFPPEKSKVLFCPACGTALGDEE